MRVYEGLPFTNFHGFRSRDQALDEGYSCLNIGIATILAALQFLVWPPAFAPENQEPAEGPCVVFSSPMQIVEALKVV